MKNSYDTIGNRPRDLAACSAEPQAILTPSALCHTVNLQYYYSDPCVPCDIVALCFNTNHANSTRHNIWMRIIITRFEKSPAYFQQSWGLDVIRRPECTPL